MPRQARNKINGNFYHVMSQGINKEAIFDNDIYKKMYIKLIFEHAVEYNIKIVAYCIMTNHVHLLLQIENIDEMSEFMKMINMKFAMIYNKLEDRVGVVFRNRFKSEYIDSEEYLYNCIYYIHNNPVKAGIVKEQKLYQFSSANNYNLEKTMQETQKKNHIKNNDFIDFIDTEEDRNAFLNDKLESIIDEFKKGHNLEEINIKDKLMIEKLTRKLKNMTGASNIEIARILRYIKINCF